jgi:hypothetical protein
VAACCLLARSVRAREQSAAGAEEVLCKFESIPVDATASHLSDCFRDVVLDSPHLNLAIFDHAVSGSGVAIARLPNRSGIDDFAVSQIKTELCVRMADADKIGIDVLEPLPPTLLVLFQILVERIPWRRMDHVKLKSVEFEPPRNGDATEET